MDDRRTFFSRVFAGLAVIRLAPPAIRATQMCGVINASKIVGSVNASTFASNRIPLTIAQYMKTSKQMTEEMQRRFKPEIEARLLYWEALENQEREVVGHSAL